MSKWRAGAALLLVGCGYGFSGKGAVVPDTAHSVYVNVFTNRTRQYGLEVKLRRSIEDEFRRRGVLKVMADKSEADVVLSGAIRSVQIIPVASGPTDEPIAYRSVMTVGFRLTDRASSRILHETPALVDEQDFAAVSSVVIPTSPHFQQGTSDLEDLVTITNVQIGESRRNHALSELVDQVARDVYIRSVEGF